MARDDRDLSFEKALARQLRSSASSGVGPNAPGAEHGKSCPDPEMLAAYHDGSLSADERNFWKQHVMGCDSCQLVLAHLETPLDIPVNLESNESVLAPKQPVPSGRTVSPALIAATRPPQRMRWLWLVPAGALAASLIAWVSLREPRPLQVAPSSPVEVAENRQPAAVSPSAKPAPVLPSERKEKDERADQSAGGIAGAISSDRDDAANELHKQAQLAQQAPDAHAKKTASGPSLSRQKQEQQMGRAGAGIAGAVDQKKLDSLAAPNLPVIGGQPAAPKPPPPPPQSQPSFLDGAAISAPSPEKVPPPAPASGGALPKSTAANVDAISAARETVEVSAEPQSRAQAKAMLRAAALQNPHVFVAPDGKHLWRVGPAGSLEHSTDKGIKWTLQVSGVDTDLQAGSAPSAKVCWVVGSSGTILRTTDGGAHWTKLDSPVTNDLTGVRATDATHAWIWFVPDQQTGLIKTYQTSDGGSTWFSVPRE